jgi:L-ascorbate metabolism protein UlaG (beta-lactamase superfamily)
MRVVKYTHSCVRLEKDDRALVIDPGSFSEEEPLDGATAVLITHEHPDHLDVEKLKRHPSLEVWTNAAVAEMLADAGPERVHVVADGSAFTAAGFDVTVHGERHEVIHPDLPPVPNIGFFVDDQVFHPGDAFTDPGRPVATLFVPVSAPWMLGANAVDYVRTVKPALALGVHDGLLNDIGLSVHSGLIQRMSDAAGVDYRLLTPGTAVGVA